MNLRPFEEKDAKEVALIEQRCFSVPWSEKELKASYLSDHAAAFLCEAEGKIVGYGGFCFSPPDADITNIAVLPEFRRRGIGEKLLKKIEEEAEKKACTAIFLEVRESNIGARGLYEKSGFVPLGKRKNYYKAPTEDAVLYKKEI